MPKIREFIRSTRFAKRQIYAEKRILVGTHHKTGTVWFKEVFREIAGRFGLRYALRTYKQPVPPKGVDIFHNSHSAFDVSQWGDFRGVHVIRDPRDQVVSATFYHQSSKERWLHEKCPAFGGLTYQEKINSFNSFDDQLLFEMENSARRAITAMGGFDYSDRRFLTVKYEDMISDYTLKHFERMFRFLQFRENSIGWCLIAAYRNSLFSGVPKTSHVRSGNPKQWPEYFKPIHRQRFEQLFPNVLKILGYSECDRWRALGEAARSSAASAAPTQPLIEQ